jgi:N-acetylglucosamine-6-sulfatase
MLRRRRSLRVVVALCVLAGALAGPAAAGPTVRPSIVLVLTDDQRWDTLFAMPTVQRELVGRGVTFTNSFAVNPLCCPSRASILTGRYSHSTGVYGNQPPHGGVTAFDDSSTIATWLGAVGYRTAYIGKYLNGYAENYVPFGWNRWIGYDGGFFNYVVNGDGLAFAFGAEPDDYSTDVFTREAVAFVETASDPFFLVFAPYAPHGPATPAPRHVDAFANARPWRPPSYNEDDTADKPAWVRGHAPLSDADQTFADDFRRRQLASLLAVDEAVKGLIDALAASGRLANTMIVFASDNGLTWGEHRLHNRKTSAYEESIRIPLVVRYDALLSDARTDSRLVTNIDLAPTFAELGATVAPEAEGKSLVPLLASQPGVPLRWRRGFLIEHLQGRGGAAAEVPTYCAVRGRRYKYVVYSTREEELYDLARDPYELVNRAGDTALRKRLFSLRAQVKVRCDPPPPGFTTAWICTLEPAPGESLLTGTRRADTICGSEVAEEIDGLGGADTVRAGAGADSVRGGHGADYIVAGAGRDSVEGGPGDDRIFVRDRFRDVVTCGRGFDRVVGDRRDRAAAGCDVVRGAKRQRPSSSR